MSTEKPWILRGRAKHKQRRRAEVTRMLLNARNGDLVLDVGCSEGFVDSFLVKGVGLLVGVDTNPESISVAKSKVTQPNICFVLADIVSLPFKSNCFNKVALLEVLEHLPRETQEAGISEVDRILKREGILVISVPHKEQITYTRCIHCGKLTPLWGHLHVMNEQKVTNLLPLHYVLLKKKYLPNLEFILAASIFEKLPLGIWLILNDMFRKIRKGYWILLKYRKSGLS